MAHKLKGSVGNFTTLGPYEAALKLEIKGHERDLANVEAGLRTLEMEIESLTPVLRHFAEGVVP
jgi:hypothetical protein